jgi:(p)ppGpp synthase/HD superfamily hydrolase
MVGFDTHQQTARLVNCSAQYARTRELVAELDQIILESKIGYVEGIDVLAARDLSFCAHFRQADRFDGQPFINQPLEVAITTAKKFCLTQPTILKAALLHAAVEHQPDRILRLLGGDFSPSGNMRGEALRLIGDRFGARVAQIVEMLTPQDFHDMAVTAQMRGDARSLAEIDRQFNKEHFGGILKRDPEAFLIKLAELSVSACSLSVVSDGGARERVRAQFGPILLEVVERLKDIPRKGHALSCWKDSLRTELMWVYARDYSSPE